MNSVMLFTLTLLAAPLSALLAQESDIITGRVVDESGTPLMGARVEALGSLPRVIARCQKLRARPATTIRVISRASYAARSA
jgi:hypothetical protein